MHCEKLIYFAVKYFESALIDTAGISTENNGLEGFRCSGCENPHPRGPSGSLHSHDRIGSRLATTHMHISQPLRYLNLEYFSVQNCPQINTFSSGKFSSRYNKKCQVYNSMYTD